MNLNHHPMALRRRFSPFAGFAAAALSMALMTGCQTAPAKTIPVSSQEAAQTQAETSGEIIVTTAPETIPPLNPRGQILPEIQVTVPDATPMPEFLRVGEEHPVIIQLQERLMELGFMDHDEPTPYFGTQTERAVRIFQRQNGLPQDGIIGGSTYEMIMSPEAKYYAAQKGDEGDDISQIQARLYDLGYLASESMLTGNFGDATEAAVLKLQEVNALSPDGKVGQQTLNLLYSDEVKSQFPGPWGKKRRGAKLPAKAKITGILNLRTRRRLRPGYGGSRKAVPGQERSDRRRLLRSRNPAGLKQL